MSSRPNRKNYPPYLAEWCIQRMAWADDQISIRDDLREEFLHMASHSGIGPARCWYWKHFLRSVFPFLKFTFYWSTVMFKNYLKVAVRNIKRHKGYAFINFAGLVIGMVCTILIVFWVQDEVSFDRFHENSDRIHRVISNLWVQSAPVAPTLKADYPEVLNSTRILTQRMLVKIGDKTFFEDRFSFADSSLFEIFTLPFVSGNQTTALSDPFTMVLTEETAEKYFGKKDPVGKTIKIDDTHDMRITGVIKNLPHNSTLQFSMIASLETLWQTGLPPGDWGNHIFWTYILLHKNVSPQEITPKITSLVQDHVPNLTIPKGLGLQPLTRIHLYEEGHIRNVYIFSLVAVFILLVAFFNFINLNTARAENRSLEVGVRKVAGANRTQLIRQFLGESIFFSLLAFLVSLFLVVLLLPVFNNLSAKQLTWDFGEKFPILLCLLGVTILTGIAAGSYPALYLSSFHPANVIRKITRTGTTRSSRLRKVLVVCQFALSIFLLIATVVVRDQLHFMRSKDVGFDKEHVIYLNVNNNIFRNRESFQERLSQISSVLSVTAASSLPSSVGNTASGLDWEGNNGRKQASWRFVAADYDYLETLKIPLAAGRSFSRDFSSDRTGGFIVNEEAVKEMEMKDSVGKWFSLWGRKGTIIGVMKNFHFRSLHTQITPLLVWMGARHKMFCEYIMLRIEPGNIPGTVKEIRSIWQDFAPNFPFEYGFLDETFGRHYRTEERMGKIFSYFTLLAVFVSCLGLFGLAAYTAELKTKEIGIRKVFGATASSIILMMSNTYTKWILLANVIAWPAAYYFIQRWLQGFAYRAPITILTFVLAALLSLLVALLTVSYQSIKAARANPVDSLRYE